MMRSLYSAVSGLKTHQTRMDVIGNNIANVNTEAFKASSVRFSEIMYQTASGASAGNGATGTGGKNAKQIGLGVKSGATAVNITGAGSAETTGNPFDLRLNDKNATNFFVVSDGTNRLFTRAGDFYVDGNGYLCMSSTGYTLQGWQVDAKGNVIKDTVSSLQVMSSATKTSAPEATDKASSRLRSSFEPLSADSAKRAEKPSVAVQKPAEPKSGTMQQDTKPDMKQMTGIDISGIIKTQPASAAPASKAGATAATGTAAAVSVKASDAAFGTPAGSSANADVINHTHEILKLYKSGKSNVEIAKLLSLGTGEVKLIIDLYKEGK